MSRIYMDSMLLRSAHDPLAEGCTNFVYPCGNGRLSYPHTRFLLSSITLFRCTTLYLGCARERDTRRERYVPYWFAHTIHVARV